MKVLRIVVLMISIVTGALAVVPARAHHTDVPPIDRSPLPKLAGHTTILGDHSGWMRVRLPQAMDPGKIDIFDFKITGHGRVMGAFLFREVDGEIHRRDPSLWMMRFGNCGTRACTPRRFAEPWMSWTANQAGDLPPGIYRLYLVVDGAPASISFETRELPGVTRLNPTRRVHYAIKTMTPRVYEQNTGVVFSAGDKSPFSGRGITLQGQWVDPIGAGIFDWGFCLYPHEAPAEQTTAYLPTSCDSSPYWHLFALHAYTPLSDGCCWGFGMALDYIPRALGNWYTTSGPVESSGAAAMWLKF